MILSTTLDRTFSIAPMMTYTDRHFRVLARALTSRTLLYTEMITAAALCHGDVEYHLKFSAQEQPVALQLGGSDVQQLAQAAKLGEEFGYAEINLNVGCPSNRVQSGQFGACLMKQPRLVARAVTAMRQAVSIPVTVKTRIGVDQQDSYEELCVFIKTVADAGCEVFIIHARKAWLTGLNPAQNRNIPPLRYEVVYQLKQDFPQLTFVINGGVNSLSEAQQHLQQVDGVMMGREAYHNPYLLSQVDRALFAANNNSSLSCPLSRRAIVINYLDYMQQQLSQGASLTRLTRALMGLYHGQAGARRWRGLLSNGLKGQSSLEVIGLLRAMAEQLEAVAIPNALACDDERVVASQSG